MYLNREVKSDHWRELVETSLHDVVLVSQHLIARDFDRARSPTVALYESSDVRCRFFGAFLQHKAAFMQHHYPEAEHWLTEAQGLLPEGDSYSQAHCLSRLGIQYGHQGLMHESVRVQSRAKQMFDELGFGLESALSQSSIGNSLMVMGDAAGAVDTLLQAFPVIEREAPTSHANTLRANVGSALHRVGNAELARTMYVEALHLPPFTQQNNARATILHNLAIIEKETGNIDEALRCYDLAMETAIAADLPERRVRLAAGKSELLTRCKRTQEAIALMDTISDNDLLLCGPIAAFDVFAVRSRIHIALNEFAESLLWFESAMRVARENSFNHERSTLLREYLDLAPMTDNAVLKQRLTEELAVVLEHRLQEMSSSITKSVDMRIAYERSLRTIEAEREKEKTDVMLEAADQTTRTIANDIHDEVGQSIAVVGLALDRILHGPDALHLSADLQFVRTQIDSISTNLRRITHSLGAVMLENHGLGVAIQELAKGVKTAEPALNIECSVVGDLSWLDMPRAKCLYRAAQTFMQNSLKHGKPRSIELQLVASDDDIFLSVADDGLGFEAEVVRVGLGLRDVKLRIERLGGELIIDSSPGKGAFVSVRLQKFT